MISRALTNLGVQLFAVWLVWRSYRRCSFAPAQKYLTFWPRFWTGLVDSCVLWPLGFLNVLVLQSGSSPALAVVLDLLISLMGLFYVVWMHVRGGQTVGKMVCKVRVVNHSTEGPISWRQALLRECVPLLANLGVSVYMLYLTGSGAFTGAAMSHPGAAINWQVLGLLSATPTLWFLIEVVTMFSNPKCRALHDLIADTTVVRTHLAEEGVLATV